MISANRQIAAIVAVMCFGLAASAASSVLELQILLAGSLGSVFASIPLAFDRTDFRLRPIWTITAISTIIAYGARSIGVSLLPSWRSFFYGDLDGFRAITLIVAIAGIATLSLGYVIGRSSPSRRLDSLLSKITRLDAPRRWGFAAAVTILISAAATTTFVRLTGGLDLQNLSAKRGVFLDDAASGSSLFILRIFAELPLLYLLVLISGRQLSMKKPTHAVMATSLFVAGSALPFLASQREVIVSFLGLLSILLLLRSGGAATLKAISTIAIGFLVVSALTGLRGSSDDSLPVFSDPASAIEPTLVNRNFGDLSKTLRIVEAVPLELDYDFGYRQFGALAGVVPRALWASKPIIGSGPEVSAIIYKNESSGIPPGLLAESHWSFGPLGLLVITAFGFAIGRADSALGRLPELTGSALYFLGPTGLDALGVGLGYASTALAVRAFQLWLLLLLGQASGYKPVQKRLASGEVNLSRVLTLPSRRGH